MMRSKSTFLVVAEFILLSLTLALAGAWIVYPKENFEPYTIICGAILSGIEIIRRYINKSEARNYKFTVENIKKLEEAACRIADLLGENPSVFAAYGPNSSASNTEPLRIDMALWDKAKAERILPNNREIEALIETFLNVVPPTDKGVFEEMLSHIYAFEKHCEDPSFDYSNNRFPSSFPGTVETLCFRE